MTDEVIPVRLSGIGIADKDVAIDTDLIDDDIDGNDVDNSCAGGEMMMNRQDFGITAWKLLYRLSGDTCTREIVLSLFGVGRS